MKQKKIEDLRSQRWFSPDTIRSFSHRQRMQQAGWRRDEFMGRPIIAIINTWSELSPCHIHLRERATAIKRGVIAAGGFPVELPALSLGEVIVKPSTMLYRNMLAMEVEELLRSHPVDGAVLLGGCDKTTPALLMGAFSMDLPAIFCPAGPMLNGQWHGQKVGAGTHTKKFWDERRLGKIDDTEWIALESVMTRSIGTCNTMGTASTMTSIVDAMGLCLMGSSSIPAADQAHVRMATECGSHIVNMVWNDLKPSRIINKSNFINGLVAYMALGGSTNAAIHLIAMARRLNILLSLEEMAQMAKKIPVLVNLFPAGEYLMEDFYFAGGMAALLSKVKDHLDLEAIGVGGNNLGKELDLVVCHNDEIIRDFNNPVIPLSRGRTLILLKGNICPDGAVMKTCAASPALAKHTGPALVFDDHETLSKMIDDPLLDVSADTVLILRNAGPIGAPGMPEWGNLPIPKKLLETGVRDMIRISDARMSGTHYGSCILHVAPESAIGGPLALIKNGDLIELDVNEGRLNMLVSDTEIARRRENWTPYKPCLPRSYAAFYQCHVRQANEGCDFDFMDIEGKIPEPEIY